ncbi:unnamed protein product [Phytomonas sp. Hart1]|nr:unnamed protein product [Phytomonas sp. Hart1]|eukprot:CCW71247.1 unnamed protein product [Phytomonas sp. isolate Hart1]
MRYSHCQRVLETEHKRQTHYFGREGRITQLKYTTSVLLALYLISWFFSWSHPTPTSQIWIDEVLVEVLQDSWITTISGLIFSLLFISSALLFTFVYCTRPEKKTLKISNTQHLSSSTEHPQSSPTTRDHPQSSLRPSNMIPSMNPLLLNPRTENIRTEKLCVGEPLGMVGSIPLGKHNQTVAAGPTHRPRGVVTSTTSVCNTKDLENFLRTRIGSKSSEPFSDAIVEPVLHSLSLNTPLNPARITTGSGRLPQEGCINVHYNDVREEHLREAPAATGAVGGSDNEGHSLFHVFGDVDWLSFGVRDPEHALFRLREWVRDICSRLNSEIEQCDQWLASQELTAFDCNHSLQETLSVKLPSAAMPSPSFTWGQPQTLQQQPLQQVQKQELILSERQKLQRSVPQNFNVISYYNQRLALEKRLDVTRTLPQGTVASNSELAARQHYVVSRLGMLAKSKKLLSYKHNSGDTDTWREGFPCDAHILLHVIRNSVEGMEGYIRLGFHSSTQTQDLAICVGDTGEPYFYVRYRTQTTDQRLTPYPGPNSLFESLLIYTAIIHRYHHDVYGGIRGTVDLKRTGLINILKEY